MLPSSLSRAILASISGGTLSARLETLTLKETAVRTNQSLGKAQLGASWA